MEGELRALETEVALFHAWLSAGGVPPEQHTGVWANDYPLWDRIPVAFDNFLAVSSWREWDEPTTAYLLQVIGLGSEFEYLVKAVARRLDDLLYLAEQSVTSRETSAKWQFAIELSRLQGDLPQVESLLMRFVSDEDHFVRCCALISLSEIGSSEAEELAVAMWNNPSTDVSELEYQRQVVLRVLWKIGSAKLESYLDASESDSSRFVRQYVARIRAGEPDWWY